MNINLPDPHPGRCRNTRTVTHADTYIEVLQCLDYEGTRHVCEFPESVHSPSSAGPFSSYHPPTPKRWVRPSSSVATTRTPTP
jgi:hypothetical protein